MKLLLIHCLILTILVTLVSCGGGSPAPPAALPTISGTSLSHGSPGANVVLTGTNLSGVTSVSFNGHPAFSFSVVHPDEVDAVVPASATSGAILVTTPNGTATSASFTVDAALTPTIGSFTPSALSAGSIVILTGTHFVGATQVQFNSFNATTFSVTSDTQIEAAVPSGLTDGTISVTTPGGTTFSSAGYIFYGAPTLTGINPTQGPVGTLVVLTGTNLGFLASTITLNGLAIALATQATNQITFTLPEGATSGNLIINTPGGTANCPFMIASATAALDLHIERMELTQSTQTVDNTVPIVAGKAGLVRVFVLANQSNLATPAVEITLMNGGAMVAGYPKIVAAPSASVPAVLDETSLTKSWNLSIPATDLTTPTGSGYSIQAVIDPTGALAEIDKTNNSATLSLIGTTVPTFKTTIFPVALSSGNGNITEGNKAAWVARLAKMYPIGSVEVLAGSAFTGSQTSLSSDGNQWSTMLNELATKHQADGASDRYYFGAINVNYSSGIAGVGYVPGSPSSSFQFRTAIGWDKTGYSDGGNFPEVFAHETGHNMGRLHSPCGGAATPDPNYPYADGTIGVWGYDSILNQLYSPLTYKDIMAYCSPDWVSDYTYKGILAFRGGTGGFLKVGAEDAPLPKSLAVAQECLIVRGIVHGNGKVEMLPSFRTSALPSAIPSSGDYTLECLNQQGLPVFTAALELMELGCAPNGRERHFVMALPLPVTILDAIVGLNVLKDGGVQASLRSASLMAKALATAPEIRRLDSDRVQLTWDATIHPAALVRDADSGEVIAILTGGSQILGTRAQRFDVVVSDGLAGRTHRLEVPN